MEKIRILVVDSDGERRNFIKFGIEKAYKDIDIDDSADNEDALIKLQEKSYDLVIIDVTDRQIRIKELLNMISSKSSKKRIFSLVMAAKGDKEAVIFALQKGADGYINMPFTIDGLLRKIAEFDEKFDRREFSRQGLLGKLTFLFGDNSSEGEIIDISLGGVLANLSRNNPMPQILDKIHVVFPASFETPDPLSVEAIVIRIQAVDIDPASKKVRFAVKFTDLDPQKRDKLKEVVEDIKSRL